MHLAHYAGLGPGPAPGLHITPNIPKKLHAKHNSYKIFSLMSLMLPMVII